MNTLGPKQTQPVNRTFVTLHFFLGLKLFVKHVTSSQVTNCQWMKQLPSSLFKKMFGLRGQWLVFFGGSSPELPLERCWLELCAPVVLELSWLRLLVALLSLRALLFNEAAEARGKSVIFSRILGILGRIIWTMLVLSRRAEGISSRYLSSTRRASSSVISFLASDSTLAHQSRISDISKSTCRPKRPQKFNYKLNPSSGSPTLWAATWAATWAAFRASTKCATHQIWIST